MKYEQSDSVAPNTDASVMHPVDQKIIDELREVMEDDFIEIIDLYLNNVPSQIKNIKDAAGKKEADVISRTAHNLKSSSGNIGAKTLFNLCKTLEDDGRVGEIEGCLEVIRKIEAEFEKVKVFLESEKEK